MKRTAIFAALLLMTITSFAQNGKSIYQKYSDAKDISAIYISPAMFRLIGKIPELSANAKKGDIDLSPVISSLTGMYVIESRNQSINLSLASEVKSFISSGKYELLMEAKDEGETMQIYTVGEDNIVNGFVMLAVDKEETTFICIDGKMKRSDLEKILAEQMK